MAKPMVWLGKLSTGGRLFISMFCCSREGNPRKYPFHQHCVPHITYQKAWFNGQLIYLRCLVEGSGFLRDGAALVLIIQYAVIQKPPDE